ncbi:hypothetical protein [Candidatus Marithrix sp. Canyon 246]|uniref:hypothetical protein n=1 Tax=Candidatus Marithrix sp. Canyon 246 TaxID=1827136 RepID=UPI000849EE6E|nr:hypothetical protein [Candidatus Marithrix sp. Canyon 246]
MLILKIKKGPFTSNIKWFCPRPRIREAFGFFEYRQSLYQKPVLGFHYDSFYTIQIDLTSDEKTLLANCRKNTRYEINRARREGVKFQIGNDIDEFIKFYNEFALSKNMAQISNSDLKLFTPKLYITKALYQEQILVMHTYLFDDDIKRVRLLHSASLFRNCDDSIKHQIIGRANRFLHFEDMLYFKKIGVKVYDFGGYAVDDINEEREKINQFKKGFGGKIVKEPNYYSYPLYLYLCMF